MENPVYLDYNATTPIDLEVAIEMMPYIETFFGNPSSSYYDYGKHGKNFHRKKHYHERNRFCNGNTFECCI